MFFALESRAVPVLEDLAQTVVILLLKSIELDDARASLQNTNLVAFSSAAPLRATNIALVECEGVAAIGWLPSEARLSKSALAALLG
jgi:hypothetical protein